MKKETERYRYAGLLSCQYGWPVAKWEMRSIPVATSKYNAPVTARWSVSRNLSPWIRAVVDGLYVIAPV